MPGSYNDSLFICANDMIQTSTSNSEDSGEFEVQRVVCTLAATSGVSFTLVVSCDILSFMRSRSYHFSGFIIIYLCHILCITGVWHTDHCRHHR